MKNQIFRKISITSAKTSLAWLPYVDYRFPEVKDPWTSVISWFAGSWTVMFSLVWVVRSIWVSQTTRYRNVSPVNAERYQSMLSDFLWPQLNHIDVSDVYFQQDGATCHTTWNNIMFLRSKFFQRVISQCRFQLASKVMWSNTIRFFLWGFLKSRVYANKPQTINDLKNNIQVAICEITPATCQKVIENFDIRIDACRRNRGGHLSDILFHV